jgi:hypothetical protein
MTKSNKDKENSLSHDYLIRVLNYNPDTGIFTRIANSPKKNGKQAGHLDYYGYVRIRVNYLRYMAHRLAWFYIYKEWPKNKIDHINRIRNDNRICNLRDVSDLENSTNTNISKKNKSGYKGVLWRSKKSRWEAYICVNKKNNYIGMYKNKEDAIKARKEAEIKFGIVVPEQ